MFWTSCVWYMWVFDSCGSDGALGTCVEWYAYKSFICDVPFLVSYTSRPDCICQKKVVVQFMVLASFPKHPRQKRMALALVYRWASPKILFHNLFPKSTELLILSGWLQIGNRTSYGACSFPTKHYNIHYMGSAAAVFSNSIDSKTDIDRFWLLQMAQRTFSWAAGSLDLLSKRERKTRMDGVESI